MHATGCYGWQSRALAQHGACGEKQLLGENRAVHGNLKGNLRRDGVRVCARVCWSLKAGNYEGYVEHFLGLTAHKRGRIVSPAVSIPSCWAPASAPVPIRCCIPAPGWELLTASSCLCFSTLPPHVLSRQGRTFQYPCALPPRCLDAKVQRTRGTPFLFHFVLVASSCERQGVEINLIFYLYTHLFWVS